MCENMQQRFYCKENAFVNLSDPKHPHNLMWFIILFRSHFRLNRYKWDCFIGCTFHFVFMQVWVQHVLMYTVEMKSNMYFKHLIYTVCIDHRQSMSGTSRLLLFFASMFRDMGPLYLRINSIVERKHVAVTSKIVIYTQDLFILNKWVTTEFHMLRLCNGASPGQLV